MLESVQDVLRQAQFSSACSPSTKHSYRDAKGVRERVYPALLSNTHADNLIW